MSGGPGEAHPRSTEVGDAIERDYGAKVVAVDPGGIERIPQAERHGRPLQPAWTFSSPNLEFATLFVGVLAVQAFGLAFGYRGNVLPAGLMTITSGFGWIAVIFVVGAVVVLAHFDPSAAPLAGGAGGGSKQTIMVTTLSPCWYCSGLVRQFGIEARPELWNEDIGEPG